MLLIKILSIINAVLIITYGIGAFIVLPDFENVFVSFDAELPLLTKIIMASYPYWLATAVIPIGIYVKYLRKEQLKKSLQDQLFSVSIVMTVFLCTLLPTVIYAMYLPIFQLEAASG